MRTLHGLYNPISNAHFVLVLYLNININTFGPDGLRAPHVVAGASVAGHCFHLCRCSEKSKFEHRLRQEIKREYFWNQTVVTEKNY